MKLRYSLFLLAGISVKAIAKYVDPSSSLALVTFTAGEILRANGDQDTNSTLYSPINGRNSDDNKSKLPALAKLQNNEPAQVFGYSGAITGGNSAGSYPAVASSFRSSSNMTIGNDSQSDFSSSNQIGGASSASRALASAQNNLSNTGVAGVNFPPAASTSNSGNQIGSSAKDAQVGTTNTSKTASDLYQFNGVNVPELAAPALPQSASIVNNISSFQQPATLIASNDPFSYLGFNQFEYENVPPTLPKTLNITPYIPTTNIINVESSLPVTTQLASNSVEAPAEASILTSPSLTVANPSPASNSVSPGDSSITSSTTTNSSLNSVPSSNTSSTSSTNAITPSETPASTNTHEELTPTAGSNIVTASNSATATPQYETKINRADSSKDTSTLSSTKSGAQGSLQLYDPTLPAGIPNGTAFKYNSINHDAPVVAKLFPAANSFCTSAKYKQLVEYVLQGNGFAKENGPDKAMSELGFGDNYEEVINKCVVPNAELSKEFASYLDSALNIQCRSLLKNYEVPMVIVNPYGEQYIKNSSYYSYITRIFNSESNKIVYFRCNNIYALRNGGSFKDIKPNLINEDKIQHSLTAKAYHSGTK